MKILNRKALETVKHIEREIASNGPNCVVKMLELVRELSADVDRVSIGSLVEVIGRDLAFTAKVLRVAKPIGYNPEGIEINTLDQAINFVGLRKIRSIAISLLLSDEAGREDASLEIQDLVTSALCSGLMAQELCERRDYLDSDLAFVVGTLRNYGALLLASYMLEDYRTSQALTAKLGKDAAEEEVFGLTQNRLAVEILRKVKLPPTIIRCLEPLQEKKLRAVQQTVEEEMRTCTEFSIEYCRLLDAPDLTQELLEARLARMVEETYGRSLRLREDGLVEIVGEVDSHLNCFFNTHGIESVGSVLIDRIKHVARGRELPEIAKELTLAEPMEIGVALRKRKKYIRNPKAIFRLAIDELSVLQDEAPHNVESAANIVANSYVLGVGFTNVLVFTLERHSETLLIRGGIGRLFETVKGRLRISPEDRDIFHISLVRHENAVIRDPDNPAIASYVPRWLKQFVDQKPWILIPVVRHSFVEAFVLAAGGGRESQGIFNCFSSELRDIRHRLMSFDPVQEDELVPTAAV